MRKNRIAGILVAAMLLAAGHEVTRAEVPTGAPEFSDPLDIDNEYNPFVPFRLKVYRLVKGEAEAFDIDVHRGETRTIPFDGDDVECAILEEWAIEEGEIVEISRNYFAQADDGTTYYFGEIVDIYEGGVLVGHDGSWLVGGPTGSDPAETATATEPAVFMPAKPEVGDEWKSEDLPDEGIEEFNTAVDFDKTVRVPAGRFRCVLEVKGETPDIEHKWYAKGVGFIKSREGGEILAMIGIEDSDDGDGLEEELDELLEEILGDEEDDD